MLTRWLSLAILCAACGSDDSGLTEEELSALEDGVDSVDTDGTVVDNVEVTLSGTVDPAQSPDAAATASALAAKSRLTPATCLDTTVQGNVATHVLTGCTGPGGRMLSGTVVSTWTRDGTCLQVEHATTDFRIGGALATGSLAVTICRSGATETRMRTLSFAGTTRRGKPISLTGSWDISLDTTSGCATQSGTVTGQIGDRMFDRADTDFEWCATQSKRAPLDEGASIQKLVGGEMGYVPGLGTSVEFRVEFLGDSRIRITTINSGTIDGLIDTTTGEISLI